MGQALKKEERLVIPRRKTGEAVEARPCLGDRHSQLEKVRERSFARYGSAYKELARV